MEGAAPPDHTRAKEIIMRWSLVLLLLLGCSFAIAAQHDESVDSLKQRLDKANPAEQVRMSLHIATTQLQHMSDYYKAGDDQNARRALDDVAIYGVKAANISAESGKRQKDAEIAVRRLSFRLNE